MWNSFVNLISGVLDYIYGITNNYGIAVIIFTILMRLALLPLDLKAKASSKKLNDIQPQLKEINEKYKNDADKRNKATMELYQEHKINPLGGCLPMLIQMPVLFALFAALRQIADAEIANFLTNLVSSKNSVLFNDVASAVKESTVIKANIGQILQQIFQNDNAKIIAQLKEVVSPDKVTALVDVIKGIDAATIYKDLPSSYHFLWIKNVLAPDSPIINILNQKISFLAPAFNGLFILPALAGITSYFQMKLTTPANNTNNSMAGMSTIFPIMSVWFTSMYTAIFAIYWVMANIFQIVQQLIYNRFSQPKEEGVKK